MSFNGTIRIVSVMLGVIGVVSLSLQEKDPQ